MNPLAMGQITDVRRPDLVRPFDRDAREQVGVDFMAATRRAGATFRVQRRHTHVAHQTLDALAIDRMPPRLQLISDPAAAVARKLEVDLVDQTHQDQVFVRHRTGAAVRRRAGHLKQLAASGDW